MFTGIVETVGTIVSREPLGEGIRFRAEAPELAGELSPGDSIDVDGACQTVVAAEGAGFAFESVRTTLSRTTFGDFEPGRPVNLERALRADARLGGHLVQGHVDGVGQVVGLEPAEESRLLRIRLPAEVAELTAPRGSLAVDGISLTVAEMSGDVAQFAIIPYTWSRTSFPRLEVGSRVNLEADLIARYLHELARPYLSRREGAGPEDRSQ